MLRPSRHITGDKSPDNSHSLLSFDRSQSPAHSPRGQGNCYSPFCDPSDPPIFGTGVMISCFRFSLSVGFRSDPSNQPKLDLFIIPNQQINIWKSKTSEFWSNLLAVGAFCPSAGAAKNLAIFRSSLVESHATLLKQLDQSLKELEKAWWRGGWGGLRM